MTIPTIILLLLGTLALALVGIWVLSGERARRADIAFVLAPEDSSALARLRRAVEKRVTHTPRGARLRRTLDNADLSWPVADTLLGGAVVLVVLGIVSWSIGGPVLCIIAMTLAVLGARSMFKRREEARYIKFVDQLPDLARLLANSASAGLSLRAGLSLAAQESIEPTRSELARVNEELVLGSSMDAALTRMGDRMPSRELAVLVNVLVIQARAGGKIVTALQGITEALETRRDLRREVNTLVAGSRATVLAVSVLGLMMVLLVHSSVEGGMRAVLSTTVGVVIFVVSLSLFLFGIWLARKAAKVEV